MNYDLDSLGTFTSCKDILEKSFEFSKLRLNSGIYKINPSGNDEFEVYCDMITDGGGFTLIGKSNGNYPDKNFLDGFSGNPQNTLENTEYYSVDASVIDFNEVIIGVNEDTKKFYGFEITPNLDKQRVFESENTGSETSINHTFYYTYDYGKTRYYYQAVIFDETMISNRGDSIYGGIDLAQVNDVLVFDSTAQEIAIYREGDAHWCFTGNCGTRHSSESDWNDWTNYYQPHPTLTPTKDEVSYENAIDVSDKVWIMVR